MAAGGDARLTVTVGVATAGPRGLALGGAAGTAVVAAAAGTAAAATAAAATAAAATAAIAIPVAPASRRA